MPLQVQLNAAQLQLPAAAAADAVPSAADDSSSRAVMRSSSAISVPLAVIVSATASSLHRQRAASLSRRTSPKCCVRPAGREREPGRPTAGGCHQHMVLYVRSTSIYRSCVVRFRVWNTSSFVILTAAYSIQPYFVYIAQPGKVADFECPVLTRCEFEPVMFGRRNQPHHQAAATRSESAESADLNSKLGTKRRQPERSQPGAAHEAGWVAR